MTKQAQHPIVTVTFLERQGCHLCDEARTIVDAVVRDVNADPENETNVSVKMVDIDTDPELQSQYDWEVPVVLINERQHSFHRVDAKRLRSALQTATRRAANTVGETKEDSAGRRPE